MKPSIWAALLAAAAPAWARQKLETVIVTGNPLGSSEVATPSSVLSGNGLVLRRGSSLGETLDGLPGVSSSYFGPNANRPVIRGQDGDRLRVLSNSGASLDASSLSFDHAVPIDPLVVERIEVLRGPAALLYGGSAVGGVVNAIDNRIPKARLDGLSGALETRFGGAANERAVSALVETGGSGFALHADAFGRKTDDLRVPAFDRPLADGSTERRTRVVNSASRAHGGAVGASLVGDHGYLGTSVDTFRNDSGIVAEDDITIQMRRDRFALAGELRVPDGFITALRGQAASTDYQHQEVDGDGAVGTTFKIRGSDTRVVPLLGTGRGGLRAVDAYTAGGRLCTGALDLGRRWPPQRRRARRAGAGALRGRCGRDRYAIRTATGAQVFAAKCVTRGRVEPEPTVAAVVELVLHRAGADELRAVCQRRARRHQRIRAW